MNRFKQQKHLSVEKDAFAQTNLKKQIIAMQKLTYTVRNSWYLHVPSNHAEGYTIQKMFYLYI